MNNIRPGLCGLFFTVDGDEKRAVREAFNVIDRFMSLEECSSEKLDDVCAKKESEMADGPKDVSDSLASECQQIRQNKRQFASNAVRQHMTGARCSLFFASPMIRPNNVYKIAEKMVDQSQKESLTRFLARVIPVEETCHANLDEIKTLLSEMIVKHLKGAKNDTPPTYAVEFKASNTKLLNRQQIYDLVAQLMNELSPDSAVNLTQPDLLVVVHTIRTVTMLSIVANYYQRRKFALKLATESESKEKSNEKQNTTHEEGET
ncbi:hypothetical protein niasHT_011670 [Heterodera trifolii]|uniref:THUMP domain-containing protein n=1 Tax=Heterodera trifolii TaxID=157864 RepID=A0ABD2L2R7_9BILA